MELMNVLSQIPLPVVVAVVTVLVIVTLVCVYQYTKMKGLDGIRGDVYQLILKAEHVYNASGQGEQKLKWVVQQARSLLPRWLQVIVSEEMLIKVIEEWFAAVKDLLDDGKVNGSRKNCEPKKGAFARNGNRTEYKYGYPV